MWSGEVEEGSRSVAGGAAVVVAGGSLVEALAAGVAADLAGGSFVESLITLSKTIAEPKEAAKTSSAEAIPGDEGLGVKAEGVLSVEEGLGIGATDALSVAGRLMLGVPAGGWLVGIESRAGIVSRVSSWPVLGPLSSVG
jgi:hypothetical protein